MQLFYILLLDSLSLPMVTVLRTSAAVGSPPHLDLGKSLVSHVLYTRVFTSSPRAPHPQSLPHLSSGQGAQSPLHQHSHLPPPPPASPHCSPLLSTQGVLWKEPVNSDRGIKRYNILCTVSLSDSLSIRT